MMATHPIGRIGEPIDIAKACAFFASDESNWITGDVMTVSQQDNALKSVESTTNGNLIIRLMVDLWSDLVKFYERDDYQSFSSSN